VGPQGGVAFYHTVPQGPHALGDFRIVSAGNVAFGALNQPLDIDGPFVSGDSTSFSLFASDSTRVKVTAESLTLGGRLLVYSSATLQIGARFVLFSAPSRSGVFTNATLPALPAGQEWQITYPPGEVVLTVVSATGSEDQGPPPLTFDGPVPNPNDGSGTIRLAIPRPSRATVSVHDVLGRVVALLLDGEVNAGIHELALAEVRLSAGAYVVRLETDDKVLTRRFVIAR
jgi:hypothetical protein